MNGFVFSEQILFAAGNNSLSQVDVPLGNDAMQKSTTWFNLLFSNLRLLSFFRDAPSKVLPCELIGGPDCLRSFNGIEASASPLFVCVNVLHVSVNAFIIPLL
jgi:hypothetical protein